MLGDQQPENILRKTQTFANKNKININAYDELPEDPDEQKEVIKAILRSEPTDRRTKRISMLKKYFKENKFFKEVK